MNSPDPTIRTICGGDATIALASQPAFVTIATGITSDTININPTLVAHVNSGTAHVFTVK